jgi:acetolactate synthase-1/2/3 large subunit
VRVDQPAPKRSIADVVVENLAAAGVDKVFGVPGGAMIPFHTSVEKHAKIDFVLARHEGGAAFMADCYARVTGGLGVCCATTGPGATNLMTGVGAAYMDSIPMLVITGMNPTESWGRGDFQECTPCAGVNTTEMFKSVCKSSEVVISEKTLQQRLRNAITTAVSGRPGPVHLAIPRDLWGRRVTPEPLILSRCIPSPPAPSVRAVERVAKLLLESARPLVIYGGGTSSGALFHLFALCERFDIPIVSTPRGKGRGAHVIPEVYLGHMGIAANSAADDFIADSVFDVIVVVGSSLGSYATNSWDLRFTSARAIIQVNIDPSALGRIIPADIGMVADGGEFAQMLHEAMTALGPHPTSRIRAGWLRKWRSREKWAFPAVASSASRGSISPMEIIRAVDNATGMGAIILADSNSILLWATHFLPERPDRRFISFWGSASMGHATAGVIGAKLAAPQADVVALVGDGCFLMNGTELATAVDLDLCIVWVINANSQLGMIHYELRDSGAVESATLGNYDFAAFARSLGARGIMCDDSAALPRLIVEGLCSRGPTVIQVNVDPDLTPPMGRKKEGSARWKAYVESL